MTLKMTLVPSFRATLSVAKGSSDELPIHMESLWSTGLHTQRTSAPGARTEEPPWRSILLIETWFRWWDPGLQTKPQWDETWELGGKAWVYFPCMGIWTLKSKRQIMVDYVFLHETMFPVPFAYNVMLRLFPLRDLCSPPGMRAGIYDCLN